MNGVYIPKLDLSRTQGVRGESNALPSAVSLSHLTPHEGSAFLERATALVRLTQGRVAEDHLTEALKPQLAQDGVYDQSTTVGIMFEEVRINYECSVVVVDGVMFGGPAYRSKQISKGDIILAVDGMQLYTSDAILAALKGSEIPGTSVTLTMKNPVTNVIQDVIVQRQLTAEVADKRKMFDLFTSISSRATRNRDADTVKDIEQALELWTDMLVAEEEKDARCVARMEAMQGECDAWLAELLKLLENVDSELKGAEDRHVSAFNDFVDGLKTSTLSDVKSHPKNLALVEGMQLAELVEFCENLCRQLYHSVSSSVLAKHDKVGATTARSQTTIGIMLCGLTIDQMVEGGPAHNSGLLEPGDELLKVDGKDVTEDTFPSIVIGSDTPGSIVTLTVLKTSGQKRDVTLRRMSRESISDQVTMFELFTNVKEVAEGQDDVVAGVDACMRHWSEMLRVSQDTEASLVTSIRNLQEKSSLDVEMCLEGLKRMWEFSKDRDLLQEMYSHASNGVRELQEDLMRAQERILKKASLTCVHRERKVARDAVEKAVRQAKLEAQALQNEMEKTQNELKAEKAVLTRQLQECTSELKKETKKVQELQTDVIVKANKISSLHEQIDSLKLRIQEEAASKQAEIEDKKKHISELLASLVQQQELQNHLSSDLKNTANELGHSRQATHELEKRLEAEVEMLSTKVQSLNAEIERLKAELNASSEEVHIVLKKHETVQRAVCETKKILEDKEALYTMHQKNLLAKYASRLMRKSVANEFGMWRDMAQAALYNRSMTWLEQQLQEKDSEIKEAVERLAELEKQCDSMCRSADEASATWLCCEAKLGENIKKMSVELCSKQAEIEHLRSEVKAALNEKESIKHDLTVIQAHYQTELSEHRSKLGGKTPRTPRGLTPRDTTQTAPVGSPGAPASTPGASTTENPESTERRGKGKYYMC